MQQALLNPMPASVNPTDSRSPASDGAAVTSVINHSARLSAHEHLAIYQRSYVARLRGCMAQQFSALEYALGEDLFRAFADDYLTAFPSTHYNLAELGRRFPAHLQATRPDALSDEKEDWIDFVIELARFEFDLSELFDRPAEEGYQLASVDSGDDEIGLVPTCSLFRFQFPTNSFYTRFKKGDLPDLPYAALSHCVVLRHDYKLAVYDLPADHYEFLALLAQGMPVSEAHRQFSQRHHIDARAFAQLWPVWKRKWMEANMFRVQRQAE